MYRSEKNSLTAMKLQNSTLLAQNKKGLDKC
jgi:hypothetical protein